jgi:diketogulonate reductase-like aldo/keto reductase
MQIEETRRVRGVAVPSIMYGTAWKEERTEALTSAAIACGFRAIDTANQRKHYVEAGVGAAVGAAVASGNVTREQFFLQTKFTSKRGQDHRLPYDPSADIATQVRQSIESSLEHLGVTSLDSYILHGPSRTRGLGEADWQIWGVMEGAARSGRVGLLGVSNISAEQLAALVDGVKIAPAFVQNRCFARNRWDAGVRALCEAHGIVYQGFSLLTANPQVLSSQRLIDIARRHDKTVPQVVFRFAIELGMLPLTGTCDGLHMRQALDIFDFALSDEVSELCSSLAHEGHMTVVRLASSNSRPVHACGSCRFYREDGWGPRWSGCAATGLRASEARSGECANGALWEPMPPHVPVFVRLKRWLVR